VGERHRLRECQDGAGGVHSGQGDPFVEELKGDRVEPLAVPAAPGDVKRPLIPAGP
jgi:hypothetical protein